MSSDIKQEYKYSCLSLLLLAPTTLCLAGAFHLLYGWHVLPLTGYPLAYWQIVGLRLIAGLTVTMFHPPSKKPQSEDVFTTQMALILYSGIAILFGWLAKLLM